MKHINFQKEGVIRLFFIISSFLVPFVLLGSLLASFGIYPFGDLTLLVSDMNNQYIQYFSYLYDVYTQGNSLLYSWQAGMGLNFTGIFAYYLASPSPS